MKAKVVFFCIGLTLFTRCDASSPEKDQVESSFLTGKWAFFKMKEPEEYAEIEFLEANKIRVQSTEHGHTGPGSFRIFNDSIQIWQAKFLMAPGPDKNMIKLISGVNDYYLFRIPFNLDTLDTNQIDPFYLRRCYFFVHLNIISMEEAAEYLQMEPLPDGLIIEEKIYLPRESCKRRK